MHNNSTLPLFLFIVIYVAILLQYRTWAFSNGLFFSLSVFSSLAIFIYEITVIRKWQGSFFTPIIIFLVSFYLFQNGQLLLMVLGIDTFNFITASLQEYDIDVAIFSSISNVIAGYAAVLISSKRSLIKHNKQTSKNDRIIYRGFLPLWFISMFIAYVLLYFRLRYFLIGGYYSVRSFESSIHTLIGMFDYYYFPTSLLVIIYGKQSSYSRYSFWLLLLWSGIMAFCGNRTTGLAGVLILYYVRFFCLSRHDAGESISSLKKYVTLFFVGFLLVTASSFIADNRVGRDSEPDSNDLLSFVTETGGSVTTLYTTMDIVPKSEPYQYMGYFYSAVSGFLPSFLDVTGVVNSAYKKSRYNEHWHDKYFSQYEWGLGFSLNSEAFANWGWVGLLAIFLVCLIVFYFLRYNHMNYNNKFQLYMSCALLFSWITLPRRDTYYIWNALFYSVFVINIYISLLRNSKS